MSRLAKKYVYLALEIAADNIRAAAGEDGVTSRYDIRRKLETLTGVERDLTDIFYRFIDHRDHRKSARITETDISLAVEYARTHMIDNYDLQRNGLSRDEIARMSHTGKLAVQLARSIKRFGFVAARPDAEELKLRLSELTDGLFFDNYGSESEMPVKAFFLAGSFSEVSEDAIVKALRLDPNDINQRIERYFQPGLFWERFVDLNDYFKKREQAEDLEEFFRNYISEPQVVILGEDRSGAQPEHRVLLLGLTHDGDLAGIESVVIWT